MRKKVYSIFYLTVLVLYILKPVLPYVEYSLLKNYISKNLCINRDKPENTCNGKCFLDDQLKKSSEPVDADKDTGKKTINRVNIEDHLKAEEVYTRPFQTCYSLMSYYNYQIPDTFFQPVFVPPKF
jgi:hypothetical protein